MKKSSSILAVALVLGLAACNSQPAADTAAETEEVASNEINDENKGPVFVGVEGGNIAVSGYDTVSYFEGDGVPVKGSADYTVKYNGVEYHFASAENVEKFKAEPAKFVPAYGGHCAWAMGAKNSLAPGDPTVYEIVDGRVYLNFNKTVQDDWKKDIPGFIEKAEVNWPKIPSDAKFGG